MAHVHESKLSLRISGDTLIPDEITAILGAAPTFSHIKGQELVGKNTGRVRIARSGMWLHHVPDSQPENLDQQLKDLFDLLTDDLATWMLIHERYSADLFCGIFLDGTNEGLTISSASVRLMADRNLEIGFDIYAGDTRSTPTGG